MTDGSRMPSRKDSIREKLQAKSDRELARLLRRVPLVGRTRRLRRARKTVEWWHESEIKLLGRMSDEDLAR